MIAAAKCSRCIQTWKCGAYTTILRDSQAYISEKYKVGPNTVDFVFHGGSGSTLEEIREAIGYGVIKMNIDTDLQFAFTEGIRDYMTKYLPQNTNRTRRTRST